MGYTQDSKFSGPPKANGIITEVRFMVHIFLHSIWHLSWHLFCRSFWNSIWFRSSGAHCTLKEGRKERRLTKNQHISSDLKSSPHPSTWHHKECPGATASSSAQKSATAQVSGLGARECLCRQTGRQCPPKGDFKRRL